jgi:hypothetical protein
VVRQAAARHPRRSDGEEQAAAINLATTKEGPMELQLTNKKALGGVVRSIV